MERWRSYFGKSGTDIWTIIHQAINLAAADYPDDFRDRRGEIAETLFARKLLHLHVKHDPTPIPGEIVTSDGGNRGISMPSDDDAEALTEEIKKEALILRDLHSMKGIIADPDQSESVILEALQRLQCMRIGVETLKATDIGRHVNSLKKHVSKSVRVVAKELVRHWKAAVDEWVNSTTDVTAGATTTHATNKVDEHEEGLASPLINEDALLESIGTPVDLTQPLSFMDREMCTENKDPMEYSIKDSLHYSQSGGSMVTDSSNFDTKASTNHPWGFVTPEERGSATRDVHPPTGKPQRREPAPKGQYGQSEKGHKGLSNDSIQMLKGAASGYGPGRPCDEASKAKPQADIRKTTCDSIRGSVMTTHTCSANKSSLLAADTRQVDQKLEIAKRKLHQGYQRAENAKKQRIVQVLDLPDLPKTRTVQEGKMNGPLHSKAGPHNSYGNQNRRFA